MNEEIQNEFTFSHLYNIYKKNKKGIWIKVVIITTLVIIFGYIKPHVYQSNTSLIPPRESEMGGISGILQSFSSSLPSGLGLGGLSGKTGQSQLFSEMLKSRSIAQYIIDSLKLDKNEKYSKLKKMELISAVQDMLDVELLRNGLIEVNSSVETGYFPTGKEKDSTAHMAELVARVAIKGLDEIVINRNTSSAFKSLQYVERELVNYRHKLDSIDAILEDFQTGNKVLKIEDQTEALVKQAIDVGSELAKAQMELNVALKEFSPNHPIIIQLRAQVAELKKQYQSVQTGGLAGTDGFSIPFGEIPNLSRRYLNIYRDKKIYEQVILYLETQKHQEAIQVSKDVPVVQALDEAFVPETQASPSKKLMAILGFALSFVFSLVYHISRDYYKNRKQN